MERSVLNTREIKQYIEKHGVVPLQADWSDGDEQIAQLLLALGSKQLPVVAVFPSTEAYRPRKLTGFYTKAQLKRAIRDALQAERRTEPVSRER